MTSAEPIESTTTEPNPVRWGILGPGRIARAFLEGTRGSRSGAVVAAATRGPVDEAHRQAFPGIELLAGYESLLVRPDIDAVYVATPHAWHATWAIRAAESGKHVLCEKPVAVDLASARAIAAAAEAAGIFLGEAFMYRLHPLVGRLLEILASGKIGSIRMIRSCFGFVAPNRNPGHRLFSPEAGGGALLDLAGYPVSMARLIAGCAIGAPFADPEIVRAVAHIGDTGVDEWTSASLRFSGGIVADLSCSISVRQDNVLHVMGTTGRLEVDEFWFAGSRSGGTASIRIISNDGSRETISVHETANLYSFEFEAANAAILRGAREFAHPGMTVADTLGNMDTLERWMQEIRQT